MNDIPLNVKLENVRGKLNTALSEVTMEYGLPAFLISGILADIMLDVKRQEKIELTNSYNNMMKELNEVEKTNKENV